MFQVSGELSNNGEPMRRFMQTFVLAPQSIKKYYVHNDIFRYQDEVWTNNLQQSFERLLWVATYRNSDQYYLTLLWLRHSVYVLMLIESKLCALHHFTYIVLTIGFST